MLCQNHKDFCGANTGSNTLLRRVFSLTVSWSLLRREEKETRKPLLMINKDICPFEFYFLRPCRVSFSEGSKLIPALCMMPNNPVARFVCTLLWYIIVVGILSRIFNILNDENEEEEDNLETYRSQPFRSAIVS